MIRFIALVALLAGCAKPSGQQPESPLESAKLPVSLLVWNQAHRRIAIVVSIDGKVVHNSVAGVAVMYPAIVIREQIKLGPGTHTVVLQDRTRNVRKQVDFPLQDTPNIKVFLNPDETALQVDFAKNSRYQ